MRLLVAVLLVSFALSGCVAGESSVGDGFIQFSGSGEDTWVTSASGCTTREDLVISKDGTGSVRVRIYDATDDMVLDETVGGAGAAQRTFSVSGIPGDWTIRASTSATFAGDLSITLDC